MNKMGLVAILGNTEHDEIFWLFGDNGLILYYNWKLKYAGNNPVGGVCGLVC